MSKTLAISRIQKSGLSGDGNCYEVAGNAALEAFIRGRDVTVCHGEVSGQGPLEGVRFGHAWIEQGGTVIDRSNGNNISMPVFAYYALGKIDPGQVDKYTAKEAVEMMQATGHYGPW